MSPTTNNAADELPVLTDILVPGQLPTGVTAPAPPLPTPALAPMGMTSGMRTAPGPGGSAVERALPGSPWAAVENEVYERVLKNLQGRIESTIDQRLRETVAQGLEKSLAGLHADLKVSVREALRDVVQRAVAQEISRIRAQKL